MIVTLNYKQKINFFFQFMPISACFSYVEGPRKGGEESSVKFDVKMITRWRKFGHYFPAWKLLIIFFCSAHIVQWLLADRRLRNISMSFVLLVRRTRTFWRNELPPSLRYKIRQFPVIVALICQAMRLYILGARRWRWLEPHTQRRSFTSQTTGILDYPAVKTSKV